MKKGPQNPISVVSAQHAAHAGQLPMATFCGDAGHSLRLGGPALPCCRPATPVVGLLIIDSFHRPGEGRFSGAGLAPASHRCRKAAAFGRPCRFLQGGEVPEVHLSWRELAGYLMARPGRDRHLQPVPLRGGPGRPRPSREPRPPAAAPAVHARQKPRRGPHRIRSKLSSGNGKNPRLTRRHRCVTAFRLP